MFLEWLGRLISNYLNRPVRNYVPSAATPFDLLKSSLEPGDVLLVEGNLRVSTAIKYLTQSTWAHSALYVGPGAVSNLDNESDPKCLIEADLKNGVIAVPLSKYQKLNTRICRPIGLSDGDRQIVINYAVSRIGDQYDLKNVIDLMRYLLPTPPVPLRWRRRLLALGSGEPTRAICSTLIALAFQSVRYPILPIAERYSNESSITSIANQKEILHVRHHSLFAPRDFDISPYFKIIKPTIENGFRYSELRWK